ncbi:hypothetical protein CMV_023967 [Castanea mollissima]|uniref:Uncharacterized protein n=1 Tax=Castanea mollissima TaxID=60419 RepID=A0A8J4VA40_9ROSI|nr:hypothetical protein CMV_023967 [Castanea mollissima]
MPLPPQAIAQAVAAAGDSTADEQCDIDAGGDGGEEWEFQCEEERVDEKKMYCSKPKMPSLEEELFLSMPGKFKIGRAHSMNSQFHRFLASTSTMFLWALFLIALTASHLSFQSFVDFGSKYFATSWGGSYSLSYCRRW